MNRRSRKQSALGRASVVLATITCGYTAVFHGVWMLVMLLNSPHRARYLAEDLDSPDWFLPIAGLAIVGLVLGVLGVIKPRRHRLLPCLGVLVNFLVACDMAYQWGNSQSHDVTQIAFSKEQTMSATRGVVYMKWGPGTDKVLQRSRDSLRVFHPEMPVHTVELPLNASLLDKSRMLDLSPYDQTLYLDIDTIVMDRLDFGFEKAAKFGFACSICECPWARRYAGLSGDLIEYNTGVVFFTKQMKPLFDRWKHYAGTLDSSTLFKKKGTNELMKMVSNDQAAFAKAIEESDISPFVLPLNWNLRPIWQKIMSGPAKIWHDYSDPPPGMEGWNQKQRGEQKVIEFIALQ